MSAIDPMLPDMLVGLAPTASGACPRCGRSTRALANGRGRLEICGSCGTVELSSSEGLDVLTLRGTPLAPASPPRLKRPEDAWRLR